MICSQTKHRISSDLQFNSSKFFTGFGESDAHCWTEATHAAEGFPRHLKLCHNCKAVYFNVVTTYCFAASSSLLLVSYSCFLHDYPLVQSYWFLICLFLSVFPSSQSQNAAGSQNGTIVSALPLLILTSFTHFWLHSITFTVVTHVAVFLIWS